MPAFKSKEPRGKTWSFSIQDSGTCSSSLLPHGESRRGSSLYSWTRKTSTSRGIKRRNNPWFTVKIPPNSTEINWLETRWISIRNTTSFSFKYDFDDRPKNEMAGGAEELRHSQQFCPTHIPKAIQFWKQRNTALFLCANDLKVVFLAWTSKPMKTNAEDLDTDDQDGKIAWVPVGITHQVTVP